MKNGSTAKASADGASFRSGSEESHEAVTHDQIYLASRVSETAPKGRISPAGLQKLNDRYGTQVVEDALRELRGFPPEAIGSAYPYLATICKRMAAGL